MDRARLKNKLAVWSLTAMLAMSGCDKAPPAVPPALVGAWRSSIQFESGAFAPIKDLEFMYVFNAGGTMTESSNYDGAPPVPPAYGFWRETGPNEFEAQYEFFATQTSEPDAFQKGAGWLPAGRGVITERIALSADGQSFTSIVRYEAFGMNGETAEGGGGAVGKATRIGPVFAKGATE